MAPSSIKKGDMSIKNRESTFTISKVGEHLLTFNDGTNIDMSCISIDGNFTADP
jgi:hypothetical protein